MNSDERRGRENVTRVILIAVLVALFTHRGTADEPVKQGGYQKPPHIVQDILEGGTFPGLSVSPRGDFVLLVQTERRRPIADLARPMLKLAGLRINPQTSGPHLPPRIYSMTLVGLNDAITRHTLKLPENATGPISWSPAGHSFAFTNTTPKGIELWVCDIAKRTTRPIAGVRINATLGDPYDWMPDGKTLLCHTVPARGKPPVDVLAPTGPRVQESVGRPSPVRTFQDLLQNEHDAALFEYYGTSQLTLVDVSTGKITAVALPVLTSSSSPSPDGRFVLVSRLRRPFSYLHPAYAFPREIEVWDLTGKLVHKVASLPLADQVPIEGVPTGPRSVHWRPTAQATLVWTEALDSGDPRKKVPHRDRLMALSAPFDQKPAEWFKTEHRSSGVSWGEKDGVVLVRDYDRSRRWSRTFLLDFDQPSRPPRLLWDRSIQDRYRDPGTLVFRTLPNGHSAFRMHEGHVFLDGQGASPKGDRPFLDRFHLETLKKERLFHSNANSYENVSAVLAEDGSRFLTRHESPTHPPNFFLHLGNGKLPVTQHTDPFPELRKIEKKLVTYKRADGVPLSMTLYLPADYKEGQRLPAVLWAYPREYVDPSTAGQVVGSTQRFTTLAGPSHLFFLTQGYAILDGAAMPVIGDPETANNTFLDQIVASAKAAIDKADDLGVIDRKRVGVGGHSYGAFMTANLLAHSDLFRAGIARSGAYNRTLTPFGFQSERRTIWEAPEIYARMSPFMHAHKINEPLLLIHGEADNNPGTFPVQSERMYHAVKGNGGNVRYVTLPHESHGYLARESVDHVLYEMLAWFERYVKNAE
jgi:dipeptidyl aminopeptidase/acylaminoacyl peptidase